MRFLLFQKADLAIADLTITYEREQAVDFTMPFMNLGTSFLFSHVTFQTETILHSVFYRREHFVQEAHEKTTQFVFLPFSAFLGCMDLHGDSISWSLSITLHTRQVIT